MVRMDLKCGQQLTICQFSVRVSQNRGVGQKNQGTCKVMKWERVEQRNSGKTIMLAGAGYVAKEVITSEVAANKPNQVSLWTYPTSSLPHVKPHHQLLRCHPNRSHRRPLPHHPISPLPQRQRRRELISVGCCYVFWTNFSDVYYIFQLLSLILAIVGHLLYLCWPPFGYTWTSLGNI